MWNLIEKGLENNGLVTAFAFVGVVMWIGAFLVKWFIPSIFSEVASAS